MKPGENWNDWVERIPNRQGQDGRYAIDCKKLKDLGWAPTTTVKEYIPLYVDLYRKANAA